MEASFWHARWQEHKIGFHLPSANPLLVQHFAALREHMPPSGHIFLPLCGKTRDLAWLLAQGFKVSGAELSTIAIEELFAELGETPEISEHGAVTRYQAGQLTLYGGDIFDLSPELLGHVDGIYDRAALVALPADMRVRYTAHLQHLTQTAPQLLICFRYDQSALEGPPFALHDSEVEAHYQSSYQLEALDQVEVPGGLRGIVPATERVWLLTRKSSQANATSF